MNMVQRIVKNVGALFFGNIVHKILTLILFVYIARYLGDVGFGQYSFIISFVALFSLIPNFGFDYLIQRDVARDKRRASKYLINISFLRSILFLIAFFLILISINLLGYPREIVYLVNLYSIHLIFTYIAYSFRANFMAYEKMEYEFVIVLLNRLVAVPLSIFALQLGYGVLGLVVVLVIAGFLDMVFSFLITVKKITKPKIEIDFGLCKNLVKKALPFVFVGVFGAIYNNIDIIMLSKMQGDAVTGWYNAAYRLLTALLFIPYGFMSSIFPILSRSFVSSRDSLSLTYRKSFKYLLFLALPIATGTSLLSDRIIVRIYGEGFVNSTFALQILVWATAFIFVNSLLFTVLISINRERSYTKIIIFGAVLNVLLNLILIPRFSYIGASIATVVAEIVFFVFAFYIVSKYVYLIPLHKTIIKPVISCLGMAIFIIYFKGIITLFVIVPVAAILYFLVLFVIKGFSEEDFELLKKILRG